MNTFTNKRILILGLGISGKSAAQFLLQSDAYVFGFDEKLQAAPFDHPKFQLVTELPNNLFCIVFSPGIPPKHRLLQKAREKNIPLFGEIEFAAKILAKDNQLLAVTGTNGKTTVTSLIEHVLQFAGIDSCAAGNIGLPLSSLIGMKHKILILELSSFQIESIQSKLFSHAVVLNISPDHLDRYESYKDYAKAKLQLQECQNPKAAFYVDDAILHNWPDLVKKNTRSFEQVPKEKIEYILGLRYTGLRTHDEKNLLAAYALSQHCNVCEKVFIEAIKTFKKPPHRLELFAEFNDIQFFNDSKATNAESVIEAVKTLGKDIILIAGGSDKGLCYKKWTEHFLGRVTFVCAIGQTKKKIKEVLEPKITVKECESLRQALLFAYQKSKSGQKIVLSPGAASFDMFENYEERGNAFKQEVEELVQKALKK